MTIKRQHAPRRAAYEAARSAYADLVAVEVKFFDVPYSGGRPTVDAYKTFERRARAAKLYQDRTGDKVGARSVLDGAPSFRDLLSTAELMVVDGRAS